MSFQTYTHKGPDLEVMYFQNATVADPAAIIDALNNGNPEGPYSYAYTPMGTLMLQHTSLPTLNIPPGTYIARDSNDKVFKLTADLLTVFFDPAV